MNPLVPSQQKIYSPLQPEVPRPAANVPHTQGEKPSTSRPKSDFASPQRAQETATSWPAQHGAPVKAKYRDSSLDRLEQTRTLNQTGFSPAWEKESQGTGRQMADNVCSPASLSIPAVSSPDSGDKHLQEEIRHVWNFLGETGFLDNMASLRKAGYLPEESISLEQMPDVLASYVQADLRKMLSMDDQLREQLKEIGKIYDYLKDKAPFDDGVQDERQAKIREFHALLSQWDTPIEPVRCFSQAFVERNAAYQRLGAAIEAVETIPFKDKGNAWDYAHLLCKKTGHSQEKSDVMETLRSAVHAFFHRYAEELGKLERCHAGPLPSSSALENFEKGVKTFQGKNQEKFSAWESGARAGFLQQKEVKFKALLHATKEFFEVADKSGIGLLEVQGNLKRIRQEASGMARTWAENMALGTFLDEEGALAEPSGKVRQVLKMVMDHIASTKVENNPGRHVDEVFHRNQLTQGREQQNRYHFAYAVSALLAGNMEHMARERRDLNLKTANHENYMASRQSHSQGWNTPSWQTPSPSSHAGERLAAERLAAVFDGTLGAGSSAETHAAGADANDQVPPPVDHKQAFIDLLRQHGEALSDSASPSEIDRSYKQIALTLHPDKMPGKEEEFKQLSELHAVYKREPS